MRTTGATDIEFTYAFDENGNMVREERTEAGQTLTSEYAYDARLQLVSYTRSDGLAEAYTYDAAGNMKKRVIEEAESDAVKLTMAYNRANQMTTLQGPAGTVAYAYDDNGNMVEKALTGKAFAGSGSRGLVDTYAYDGLDRLISYAGYDGYMQEYAIGADGFRSSLREKGALSGSASGAESESQDQHQSDASRWTLEELARGVELGNVPSSHSSDDWEQTNYIWDTTQRFGQVIEENTENYQTSYVYGHGRISAKESRSDSTLKNAYVYDAHGSVVQMVDVWQGASGVAGHSSDNSKSPSITSTSVGYTPFGEMIGEKRTGFGFSGEWYDAMTGMQNLRARQYEPAMARFSQKDLLRGYEMNPASQNRYIYTKNDPVNYCDPSGMATYPSWEGGGDYASEIVTIIENKSGKLEVYPAGSKEAAESAAQVAKAANAGLNSTITQELAKTNPQVEAAVSRAMSRITPNMSEEEIDRIFAEECWNVTAGYEDYWNRQDGYFDSIVWWQDDIARNEAAIVIGAMGQIKGYVDTSDILNDEDALRAQRMREWLAAIMHNANETDFYWLNEMINNEKNMANMEQGYAHHLPIELIYILADKYNDQSDFMRVFNEVFEGGTGNLINGSFIILSGISLNLINGVYGPWPKKGASKPSNQQNAGKEIVGTEYNEYLPSQTSINRERVDYYKDLLQNGETVKPVVVVGKPGLYVIIDGHHRFVAGQETGIPVPIVVESETTFASYKDWSQTTWRPTMKSQAQNEERR